MAGGQLLVSSDSAGRERTGPGLFWVELVVHRLICEVDRTLATRMLLEHFLGGKEESHSALGH